jgi:hypothetical protein
VYGVLKRKRIANEIDSVRRYSTCHFFFILILYSHHITVFSSEVPVPL